MRFIHLTFSTLACGMMAAAASSCSATFVGEAEVEDEFETLTSETKTVTFGMQTVMESMAETRATVEPQLLLVIDEQPDNNVAVYTRKVAEETDVDEGNPLDNLSLKLKYGTHKLYFMAADSPFSSYDKDAMTVLWSASSGAVLKNCWAASVEVTVNQGTLTSQTITMPIRVANITVVLSDGFSKDTKSISMALSGGTWQLDLKKMKGCAATTIGRTFDVTGQPKENPLSNIGIFTFMPEGATNVGTLTVTAKDTKDDVITSHTMTEVPAQEAHITKYVGLFYNNNQGFTLQVANEWTTNEMTY